ncbi:putative rep13E12 repeat protein [Mycobacterium kansasii]|uniref:Putative rep13E12 repeat protein n=1 Tax=Mycobacterium kansasii TaxID=1768 RepID=A0A1V3X2S1_MYCKA|nr:putative rep13E12 repeat protein [Mycobacterium kansasii]
MREWASTHRTDIDDLTFACGPHHKLLDKGWSPEKTATAAPNGFRHHTWTRGSRGPMAFNIPRSCSPTMPTTGSRVGGPNPRGAQQVVRVHALLAHRLAVTV